MTSRKIIHQTAFNGFAMMVLGIQYSQRGPAFIDLNLISGTDVEGGSVYVTCANICYMIGSLSSGYLYGRVKVTALTIAVGLIMAGALTGATPWCTHFVSMLLVMSTSYAFAALFETSVTTEQMRICEGKSDSAMQFLSFCYSLGGIFGPLMTEPFLAPKDATVGGVFEESVKTTAIPSSTPSNKNHNISFTSIKAADNLTTNTSFTSNTSTLDLDGQFNGSLTPANASGTVSTDFEIRYAFLITALLAFIAAVPFLVLTCRSWRREKTGQSGGDEDSAAGTSRELPLKVYVLIVALGCLYYFHFTSFDDSFSQYLSYFVVDHLDWSKEDGALLTAVYWGFSTCIKLVLILLTTRVNTGVLLFVSGIGMVAFHLALIAACLLRVHACVWLFTALLAVCVSAGFGGGMAWLDGNLLQMDGKATSAVVVSASFGSSVVPLPIGMLMNSWTPMAFTYILLVLAVNLIVVFMVMLFVVKPFVHRKYGSPRPPPEASKNEGGGGGGGGGDNNGKLHFGDRDDNDGDNYGEEEEASIRDSMTGKNDACNEVELKSRRVPKSSFTPEEAAVLI